MTKKELTKMIKEELKKLENTSLIAAVDLYKIANKCKCDIYCVMSVARFGTIL
jgi:hypothetical protein